MKKCSLCKKMFFESPSIIKECPKCNKAYCRACLLKKELDKEICPECKVDLIEIDEKEIIRNVMPHISEYVGNNLKLNLKRFNGKLLYNSNTGKLTIYKRLDDSEKSMLIFRYGYKVGKAILALDEKFEEYLNNIDHTVIDTACIPICHFNLR